MRVKQLILKGFRGFTDTTFDFDSFPVILFAGNNGAGKSSVLDCIAVLLSRFASRVRSQNSFGFSFKVEDINNKASQTVNEIQIEYQDKYYEWLVSKTKPGRVQKKTFKISEAALLARGLQKTLESNGQFALPIMVYYPVGRVVLDVPLRIRTKHVFDQLQAYENALRSGSDFRVFFEWYRQQEDVENESRRDKAFKPDSALEAVRTAIYSFLPGFSNLKVLRKPRLQMVISKNKEQLIITQLSDGEKCLLAMIGDLARRLALANPKLENPLHGEGIVLIDEIELHLHPGWQRKIIPGLTRAFPNCQFILTTHSPQVISSVKPESIFVLENSETGIVFTKPNGSFGRDSNLILEEIMDVPDRPKDVKDKLDRYFALIDDNKMEEAASLRKKLEEELGSDEPAFVKADILIRRREILGR